MAFFHTVSHLIFLIQAVLSTVYYFCLLMKILKHRDVIRVFLTREQAFELQLSTLYKLKNAHSFIKFWIVFLIVFKISNRSNTHSQIG